MVLLVVLAVVFVAALAAVGALVARLVTSALDRVRVDPSPHRLRSDPGSSGASRGLGVYRTDLGEASS